jgi:uncharacterized protein YbjT (DUF2867 family)
MIVVTTPTGKIGSMVVRHLVAANERVRVIARDPSKLAPELFGRVNVVQGSSDEDGTMASALDGAEAVFLVVPPSFTANNDAEYYLNFTLPACRAIGMHSVKRVVAVSGLGRNVPMQAGPVTASFRKDEAIEKTGVDFRALWCPSFMDNMLSQMPAIKNEGKFFLPGVPELKSRHVATQDIATSGVRLLLDKSWSGQGGLAVLGPEELSFNDMASILSDVLGREIRFQRVTGEAYKTQLIQHGANATFANGLAEMFIAKANGLDDVEPRSLENTTPTTFRQWCEETFRPVFETFCQKS